MTIFWNRNLNSEKKTKKKKQDNLNQMRGNKADIHKDKKNNLYDM